MPTSEKDYEKERKQQEKKRTDILNAHLREIQRNKAQAHQIDSGGSSYGGDMIQSKTDKGLMTSSRHPETGVIHHVWHDEPKIRTEGKASNRSRGNSQMRDNGGDIDHKTEKGESISKQLKPKGRKLSA